MTRLMMDMVHHNPGEAPTQTNFTNPQYLKSYGFNAQVFKHINTIVTFDKLGHDLFPAGSPDAEWLAEMTRMVVEQIRAAKQAGLQVFYHVDLFVLPKKLVALYKDEICDPHTGRILLSKPKTLDLHRVLFDELAERFPEVDGYIIRVGETYLFDTPYHQGNGPIPVIGSSWTPTYGYDVALGQAPAAITWTATQVDAYVRIITFLRNEICVRHQQWLMFRTWDIFPDKLHARVDHYLQVESQIEPHEKLVFSIKHTALDFWRRVKFNPCLLQGRHRQIIEVQCQREYEGKGAYCNYVMDGIINGFEENAEKIGLKDVLCHPLIVGVYSWSRGGGWYGPYIQDELWPDLNAYVLAQFVANPVRCEAEIFTDYAVNILKLDVADAEKFRRLALLSARAILKGRQCEAFDSPVLKEAILPTACWMRDDRLGGVQQLKMVLEYVAAHKLTAEVLTEKAEAVDCWTEILKLAQEIKIDRPFLRISAEYGLRLFNVVAAGWAVMLAGQNNETEQLPELIDGYDQAWKSYQDLSRQCGCPSLYQDCYFALPGKEPEPGLGASIAVYRKSMIEAHK